MKISEAIKNLSNILAEHGDIVFVTDNDRDVIDYAVTEINVRNREEYANGDLHVLSEKVVVIK